MKRKVMVSALLALSVTGCATTDGANAQSARLGGSQTVRSSWYGGGEKLAKHTANGERFNPRARTAAHRTLPFGTRLYVCYTRCTVVRINDRGPATWTGRSLDLSRGAAQAVGIYGAGSGNVTIKRM